MKKRKKKKEKRIQFYFLFTGCGCMSVATHISLVQLCGCAFVYCFKAPLHWNESLTLEKIFILFFMAHGFAYQMHTERFVFIYVFVYICVHCTSVHSTHTHINNDIDYTTTATSSTTMLMTIYSSFLPI